MSRWLTPFRFEAGVWLLLFSSLIYWIGIETNWGQQWSWPTAPAETVASGFTAPPLTVAFTAPAPDALIEIALRPLFIVTRRPASALPPPEPPKPKMNKGQFSLTGTTIVPEGKFAHLVINAGNKAVVVAEGKEINGILVKTISPEKIVLTQFDDSETLVLKSSKAPLLAKPDTPQDSSGAAPSRPIARNRQMRDQAATAQSE
jgi:hypothetical protein